MAALRIVFFVVFDFLIWNPLYGQDDAYVPVYEETHHAPIFHNDQIRVLNVRASGGDTTAFHRHCNPILYITLEGTTVSLKEPAQSWKSAKIPAGWIGHDIYKSDSCFVHGFAIPDKGRLHIVAIEVLKNTDVIPISSIPIYNEGGFSVYKIELAQLPEVVKVSTPIILAETFCSGECKAKVIDSSKLSKVLLKEYRAYAVFFENAASQIME